jgi:hypothetical protein
MADMRLRTFSYTQLDHRSMTKCSTLFEIIGCLPIQEKERLQKIAAAKQAAAEARRARAAAARAAQQPAAGVGATAAVMQPAGPPAAAGAPPRPGPVQVTSLGVGMVSCAGGPHAPLLCCKCQMRPGRHSRGGCRTRVHTEQCRSKHSTLDTQLPR